MRRSEPVPVGVRRTPTDDDGHDGPLAEFSALRQEIQELVKAQQQLLSLQLTVSATIFGFAISRPGMTGLLLILPFTSYLLCGRLVAAQFGTLRDAQYIMEELNGRIPGGVGWEGWLRRRQSRDPYLLGSTLPRLLTFVATSVLALCWTFGYVFGRDDVEAWPRIGLVTAWILGIAATVFSTVLLLRMAQRATLRGR
jgi:hypothetical protein